MMYMYVMYQSKIYNWFHRFWFRQLHLHF